MQTKDKKSGTLCKIKSSSFPECKICPRIFHFDPRMGLNEKKKLESTSFANRRTSIGSSAVPSCTRSDVIDDSRQNQSTSIVPCFNGKSVMVHEELVLNGLSAISIKHFKGNCSKESSEKNEENDVAEASVKVDEKQDRSRSKAGPPDCLKESMRKRNSFWDVHRPELSKLSWSDNYLSSSTLQEFFHSHSLTHGTFCEPLHECTTRTSLAEEELKDYSRLREIVPPRIMPPDEKVIDIMEKSRSVQLKDEDLDPEIIVHKSRAEFCVTIGECIRRSPLKRSTSQQMNKSARQSTNRIESLPLQHEGLLAKNTMYSEERLSNIMGNSAVYVENDPAASKPHINSRLPGEVVQDVSTGVMQRPHDQVTEDSGDPASLRTILSPREDEELRERHQQSDI